MQIPVTAVAGSARVAIQVISTRRRPLLEIYATLRHRARPPQRHAGGSGTGMEIEQVSPGAEVFVDFVMVNIGGVRAENVRFRLTGDFSVYPGLKKLSSLGIFRGATIPQMAPAQVFPLFHIDSFALEARGPDGRPAGMSQERFTIEVEYNPPRSFLGRIRRRKYKTSFEFGADLYDGALVPPQE